MCFFTSSALHFVGKEATFWINGEFSHSDIPLEQEYVDM